MALKIDITDEKGVKASYHKIRGFDYKDGVLTVVLRSYVNEATRDSEKQILDGNIAFHAYNQATEDMKAELDTKSAQLANGDESVRERVIELSNEVNERVFSATQPQWQDPRDRYYTQSDVVLPYVEPLSVASLYTQLASDGKYSGAESI